jgi:hypothetical protein
MTEIDKRALVAELVAHAEAELATLVLAAKNTREGATHEDARPENDKDTRSTEAAYLAHGQAKRVSELERTVSLLKALPLRAFEAETPIAVGALVRLVEDERELWCFLSRGGGGLRATVGGAQIQVTTPDSPLGQALVGRTEGDDIEVLTGRGKREYSIDRVR